MSDNKWEIKADFAIMKKPQKDDGYRLPLQRSRTSIDGMCRGQRSQGNSPSPLAQRLQKYAAQNSPDVKDNSMPQAVIATTPQRQNGLSGLTEYVSRTLECLKFMLLTNW